MAQVGAVVVVVVPRLFLLGLLHGPCTPCPSRCQFCGVLCCGVFILFAQSDNGVILSVDVTFCFE